MKKILCLLIAALTLVNLSAQVTVSIGSPKLLTMAKQSLYTTMSLGSEHYFVFRTKENALDVFTLVNSDDKGNIRDVKPLKIDNGVFNNGYYITGVYAVGGKIYAAVENPDKNGGLNRLTLRAIENGEVSKKDIAIGAMEFRKLMNQGNWFISVTPDKNHLAVVGQMPREKDEPNQYKYFFLDENLQVTHKGNLSFPEDGKRVNFNSFYASNKGDLYLIENEFDKTYQYPKIYKASISEPKGTVIPVQPADPSKKIMSYTARVNEAGDLLLAGYHKSKAGVVVGDEQGKGTWWYSTAGGSMKLNDFDKPITNLNALGLVNNGDTWFLVGEQYKADRETPTGMGTTNMQENYNYRHNDVLVSAFDASGALKFEIPLAKNYSARNFDADLYPGFGILNGKLAVVYNDHYGKYFPDNPTSTSKLPVLVYINNDGLMESPVHFKKELQGTGTSYTLYPGLFTSGKSELVLLSGNGTGVKGVIFR